MYRHLGPIYWYVKFAETEAQDLAQKSLEGLNENTLAAKSPNTCVQKCISTTSLFVSKIDVEKCLALLSSSYFNGRFPQASGG